MAYDDILQPVFLLNKTCSMETGQCPNTAQLKIVCYKLYTTLSHVPEAPNLIQTSCFKQKILSYSYQIQT